MNTDATRREWLYAQAASKLMQGAARGEQPDLLEIDQWRQDLLPELRAGEVLSHVANDELCYRQWRDLCTEQRWLDQQQVEGPNEEQPQPGSAAAMSAKHWFGKLVGCFPLNVSPAWGAAVAAGIFAVVMVPAMFGPADDAVARAYQQQLGSAGQLLGAEFPPVLGRTTKSIQPLDASATHKDKYQFQLGLAATANQVTGLTDARWSEWRAALPQAISCEDSTVGDCSEQSIRNQALGSWSLVTALACSDDETEQVFWVQQAKTLGDLSDQKFSKTHFLASRLQKPLPSSRTTLCVMANGLLGQGG